MTNIRNLPAPPERVESGPVQFGDDWPGVFIRGDNAIAMAMTLRSYLESPDLACSALMRIQLCQIQAALAQAAVGPAAGMVKMPTGTAGTARLSKLGQRDRLVRHRYGGIYSYIGEALHTSTKEVLAVYEHIWPFEDGLWARPVAEFEGKFTEISREEVLAAMAGDRATAQQLVQLNKELAKAQPSA